MSVYTVVGREELAGWLAAFDAGGLIGCRGIAAGVENSNYFVTTDGGEWVLTLFERLAGEALDFYLGLMARLAARGFPCPRPLPGRDGRLWRPLAGKPAALVTRLVGECVEAATPAQVQAIGATLARLHQDAADCSHPLPNPRGAPWREAAAQRLLPLLPAADAQLLADELAFQSRQDFAALPTGVIHADLFRDNVLWKGERLSGVLDFYFAGADWLLFDLAVAANDWCADEEAVRALLAGYRQLTPAEEAAWPAMRRAAALRFWLSRLDDLHHPRPGAVVTIKDPAHFRRMLEELRLAPGEGGR